MKRILTFILTFSMVIACLPIAAFAQADREVCDIDVDQFFRNAKITKVTEDTVTFKNTDVLRRRSENGCTHIDKVSTTLSFVATDAAGLQELETLSTTSSDKYLSKYDSTYTIKIYTRLYYTITTSNGHKYLDLTKVTGGISGDGSGSSLINGITIVGNSCVANQKGNNINGGTSKHTKTKTISNSTRSWTFSDIPSSWVPVEDLGTNAVNAIYTVKLKRTTSTWSVSLSNNATSS